MYFSILINCLIHVLEATFFEETCSSCQCQLAVVPFAIVIVFMPMLLYDYGLST